MASGGEDHNHSLEHSLCSVCKDDGLDTAARHYCVECEAYFCAECVKTHRILKILKTHQIKAVDLPDSVTDEVDSTVKGSDMVDNSCKSLICTLHHGKLIDTYCKDHSKVCCDTCTVVKHRTCSTVSIVIAAKDFKSSSELKRFNEALVENIVQCKELVKKRKDNIDSIGKQEQALIENVNQYEENIVSKIRELANKSRDEIRSKHEECKTVLDKDVTALNAVKTTINASISKMEQLFDDTLLFANFRTSEKVIRDIEMLMQTMATEWKVRTLTFNLDMSLESAVDALGSLGQLGEDFEVTEYKATFVKNVNVQHDDEAMTYVHDLCILDSSNILVVDQTNKKLKRFDPNMSFKDEIMVSGSPVAVCKIGEREVAVRIRNTTNVVHRISIGKSMHLASKFTLDELGYGMTYDMCTGEIFACEQQKVSVYDKTGKKLRVYNKDTNGQQIFSECSQIAMDENNEDIFVTDYHNGLIVLDAKNGTLKMKVAVPGVRDAFPLCLMPGNICLVGGIRSDVIVPINSDGKILGNFINSADGRKTTWCALYDRKQAKLYVGGYPGVISIYKLSAQ